MSLPTPYFERDGITLYHGDCREILPALPRADLVLTDPPYGIGRDGMRPSTSSHGGRKAYEFRGWDAEAPSDDTLRLVLAAGENQIVWGANYFPQVLRPSMGWLVWDKGQRICSSDAELAFTSFDRAIRVRILNRVELAKDGAVHPTQKPVALMQWCIDFAFSPKTIIDPFAGSGSTLVAAKLCGCRAIGIEIEERYCELAARRLSQKVIQWDVPQEASR